jgi:hypothetical protein
MNRHSELSRACRFHSFGFHAHSSRACTVVLLALLLFLPAQGALSKGKFDYLKSWAEKYPSGDIDTKAGANQKAARSFFADPAIRQALSQLLNKRDYKLLTSEYQVETPIKLKGEYICTKNCRPHNCGSENAAMAFDLRDGSVYVMMFDSDHQRWFASKGKYTNLPQFVKSYMTDFSAD